jgi:hypothetical protein
LAGGRRKKKLDKSCQRGRQYCREIETFVRLFVELFNCGIVDLTKDPIPDPSPEEKGDREHDLQEKG